MSERWREASRWQQRVSVRCTQVYSSRSRHRSGWYILAWVCLEKTSSSGGAVVVRICVDVNRGLSRAALYRSVWLQRLPTRRRSCGAMAKRACGFALGKGVPQPPPKKTLLASALETTVKPLPPPEVVRSLLLPEPASLLAIDVETYIMVPTQPKGSWWQAGRFGIDTTVSDADIATPCCSAIP